MKALCPDYVLDSVCRLTPEWLRGEGYQALLLDLDGTLTYQDAPRPPEAVSRWIQATREAGFPMVIVTNNGFSRAQTFCEPFSIPFFHEARKPKPAVYHAVCRSLSLSPDAVLAVGDKLHTDVYGAHRAGLKAAMVTTLGSNPIIWLRRLLEAPFVRQAKRKGTR